MLSAFRIKRFCITVTWDRSAEPSSFFARNTVTQNNCRYGEAADCGSTTALHLLDPIKQASAFMPLLNALQEKTTSFGKSPARTP